MSFFCIKKAFAYVVFIAVIVFLWLNICTSSTVYAQKTPAPENQICGSDAIVQQHYAANPAALTRQKNADKNIAKATQKAYENPQNKDDELQGLVTIPTVVHIIYANGDAEGQASNITNQQVYQALQDLNNGFRNIAYYDPSTGVDTEIEFCLASQNPQGQNTTGIVRYLNSTFRDIEYTTEEESLKTTIGWDRTQYLNIWIVNEICNSALADPCNVAAYSYLSSEAGELLDGVVCEAEYFGTSQDNSKVLIHELGHYFNLYHTFEGGCLNSNCLTQGDRVCDTPPDAALTAIPCSNNTNSCFTDDDDHENRNPFRPTNLGGIGGQDDMINNYLDYNYRSCLNAFTEGQKQRMRLAIVQNRSSLLTSKGCTSIQPTDAGISNIISPNNFTCTNPPTIQCTLQNFGTEPLTTVEIKYQFNQGMLYTHYWQGYLNTNQSTTVNIPTTINLPTFYHTLTLYTANPNNQPFDANNNNDTTTIQFATLQQQALPFTETFEQGINNRWAIVNPDNNITWQTQNVNTCLQNGSKSMMMDNFNYTNALGETDNLFTRLDLTNTENATLTFKVAYRPYSSTFAERLRVVVSTDCGNTFEEVYNKAAEELATKTGYQNTQWTPSSCSDWRTDTVSLLKYAAKDIIIGFVNTCRWGNSLFLDNISVKGLPISPCAAPDINTLTISQITEHTAKIAWQNANNAQQYLIQYRPIGTLNWTTSPLVTSPYTLTELLTATTYEIQIKSATCLGNYESNYTPTKQFTTSSNDCPYPGLLSVKNVLAYSTELNWTQPPVNSAGYNVLYRQANANEEWNTIWTQYPPVLINQLIPNTEYEFVVQTICDPTSVSFFSPPKNFTTLGVCTPPSNLILQNVSCNTANLTWTNDYITYKLKYRKILPDTTQWNEIFTGATSYFINTLTPNATYEAVLAGKCSGLGMSEYGESIVFQAINYCNSPTNLQTYFISNQAATLSWTGNSNATEYKIQYRPAGAIFWATQSTNTNLLALNDLIPCTQYEWRTQTVCNNCNSISEYSPIQHFTTICLQENYCTLTPQNNAQFEWISNIIVGANLKTSNFNNGYADFTNQTFATLKKDTSYTLSATAGFFTKKFNEYWTVWIDFNQNKIFEPTEKVFEAGAPLFGFIYNTSPTFSGTIHIPTTATTGTTRMRVAMKRNQYPLACESIFWGETEDYLINITE